MDERILHYELRCKSCGAPILLPVGVIGRLFAVPDAQPNFSHAIAAVCRQCKSVERLTRLRSLLLRRDPEALDEELQFHVEQSIERNIAAGMTAEEARRQALIEFGGLERAREQTFEQRPGWWLGTVAQDVRYALRGFRRNVVFTIASSPPPH